MKNLGKMLVLPPYVAIAQAFFHKIIVVQQIRPAPESLRFLLVLIIDLRTLKYLPLAPGNWQMLGLAKLRARSNAPALQGACLMHPLELPGRVNCVWGRCNAPPLARMQTTIPSAMTLKAGWRQSRKTQLLSLNSPTMQMHSGSSRWWMARRSCLQVRITKSATRAVIGCQGNVFTLRRFSL